MYLLLATGAFVAYVLWLALAACSADRREYVRLCESYRASNECEAIFRHYCTAPIFFVPTFIVIPQPSRK